MENHNPTNSDILAAVNEFATHIEARFNGVDARLDHLESDVTSLKLDVTGLKSDVIHIKTVMVTKDYIDDKLADLRSDFGILVRKEDKKVNSFIKVVNRKKVISNQEAASLLATGPFQR